MERTINGAFFLPLKERKSFDREVFMVLWMEDSAFKWKLKIKEKIEETYLLTVQKSPTNRQSIVSMICIKS